jgi:large subunit ribosomal protein L28
MSRQCQLTGKKTATGNNRPFSLKATRRTFRPNLFIKKMFNPLTGKIERMKLSSTAIRTLKKWAKETGHETEADKMAKISAQVSVKKTTNVAKGRVHKEKLTPKQKKELAAAEAAAKLENKPAALETEKKEK